MARIEKYINKNFSLVSSKVMGLNDLSVCGIDETEYEISKEQAIDAFKFMIEHFKGRYLTADESDAIARLI